MKSVKEEVPGSINHPKNHCEFNIIIIYFYIIVLYSSYAYIKANSEFKYSSKLDMRININCG